MKIRDNFGKTNEFIAIQVQIYLVPIYAGYSACTRAMWRTNLSSKAGPIYSSVLCPIGSFRCILENTEEERGREAYTCKAITAYQTAHAITNQGIRYGRTRGCKLPTDIYMCVCIYFASVFVTVTNNYVFKIPGCVVNGRENYEPNGRSPSVTVNHRNPRFSFSFSLHSYVYVYYTTKN